MLGPKGIQVWKTKLLWQYVPAKCNQPLTKKVCVSLCISKWKTPEIQGMGKCLPLENDFPALLSVLPAHTPHQLPRGTLHSLIKKNKYKTASILCEDTAQTHINKPEVKWRFASLNPPIRCCTSYSHLSPSFSPVLPLIHSCRSLLMWGKSISSRNKMAFIKR